MTELDDLAAERRLSVRGFAILASVCIIVIGMLFALSRIPPLHSQHVSLKHMHSQSAHPHGLTQFAGPHIAAHSSSGDAHRSQMSGELTFENRHRDPGPPRHFGHWHGHGRGRDHGHGHGDGDGDQGDNGNSD